MAAGGGAAVSSAMPHDPFDPFTNPPAAALVVALSLPQLVPSLPPVHLPAAAASSIYSLETHPGAVLALIATPLMFGYPDGSLITGHAGAVCARLMQSHLLRQFRSRRMFPLPLPLLLFLTSLSLCCC